MFRLAADPIVKVRLDQRDRAAVGLVALETGLPEQVARDHALHEAAARDDLRVQRCIKLARFPVLKTLDQFDWNWPTKINRLLVQNLFHPDFMPTRTASPSRRR